MLAALLVVNPQATATTAAGRDVLAHALASDVKLEVLETTYRGHAADAAAQAAGDGFDLVVAHGGDGTVNEVVNGLMRGGIGAAQGVPMLGVVPGGSANVFARALGMPRDPLEATYHLLQAIETGRSRRINLGRANGRWFTFNAGVGWDAEVVAAVDELRRKQASPALYAGVTLASYARQAVRGPKLHVEISPSRGHIPSGDTPSGADIPSADHPKPEVLDGLRLAFVCNTDPWTYMGARPLRLLPNCDFDAGLSLCALDTMATPTVLRHIGQMVRGSRAPHGKHLLTRDDLATIRITSDKPVRYQVDGDLAGEQKSVEFVSVSEALRVAV